MPPKNSYQPGYSSSQASSRAGGGPLQGLSNGKPGSTRAHSQSVKTFLFQIDHLEPYFRAQSKRTNKNGAWDPPDVPEALKRTDGHLYRWANGDVAKVSSAEQTHRQDLEQYAAATVFTQSPSTPHLLAVNWDANRSPVSGKGRWVSLAFNHYLNTDTNTKPRHYYSYVDPEGDHSRLAAPSSANWLGPLLPDCYCFLSKADSDGRSKPPDKIDDGLIGRLPILIAIAAFSAPKGQLHKVLTGHIKPGRWECHDFVDGRRDEHRGMVVTVYYDPRNGSGSTEKILDSIQNGKNGPFYGP